MHGMGALLQGSPLGGMGIATPVPMHTGLAPRSGLGGVGSGSSDSLLAENTQDGSEHAAGSSLGGRRTAPRRTACRVPACPAHWAVPVPHPTRPLPPALRPALLRAGTTPGGSGAMHADATSRMVHGIGSTPTMSSNGSGGNLQAMALPRERRRASRFWLFSRHFQLAHPFLLGSRALLSSARAPFPSRRSRAPALWRASLLFHAPVPRPPFLCRSARGCQPGRDGRVHGR
jgi:hypothetical protein